jgi:hypothetical protein
LHSGNFKSVNGELSSNVNDRDGAEVITSYYLPNHDTLLVFIDYTAWPNSHGHSMEHSCLLDLDLPGSGRFSYETFVFTCLLSLFNLCDLLGNGF